MLNHHDITRDACMLRGPLSHLGYDWWWHSFTAQDEETGEDKAFFVEFFELVEGGGAVFQRHGGRSGHQRRYNHFHHRVDSHGGNNVNQHAPPGHLVLHKLRMPEEQHQQGHEERGAGHQGRRNADQQRLPPFLRLPLLHGHHRE